MSLKTFIRDNQNKKASIEALAWSGIYRFLLCFVPMKTIRPLFGKEGEETAKEHGNGDYDSARRIAYVVNRICSNTPWESKCLVRALTAQHLLRKKRMPSTLYLGVAKENDNMIAHAWIRYGDFYLTGGLGEGYTVVSKFRA